MRFSERYGYKPVREIIQKKSINEELKNRLWNLINFYIFNKYKKNLPMQKISPIAESNLNTYFANFYHNHLKESIDEIPNTVTEGIEEVRSLYFNEYRWYEIYDFIEFCILHYPFEEFKQGFLDSINLVLEQENSAYTIVNNLVIEITSEQEIQSIEQALQNSNPYSGVQQHLSQALQLMSDRQNRDYRNSIKESISAVESICKIVTNNPNASLGQALKNIKKLPPTLQLSMDKLYGYTSREDGIRHAMLEESNLSYIDAKFMLVACTNFINYLIEKTKD